MKHIFAIKDLIATEESAKHIIESQVMPIVKAGNHDIEISEILIFINDVVTNSYDGLEAPTNLKLIPTLSANSKKNKKELTKQSFAAFHNFVINSLSKQFSCKDTLVHIMDGTLDLTDYHAEYKKCETRIGEMIFDIYEMMKLLDHPVWFNTASDKGNMKFGHYYTMLDLINIDEACKLETFPDCIMYSGNSNLDWIIVDCEQYQKMKLPSLVMNNQYDYDFLSIKQLIAKFADFENGYFDNMFPTVPTEVGAYFRNPKFDKDLLGYDMSKYNDNVKLYKENLKEYKNLKRANVNNVVEFVNDVVSKKLSLNDREKLQNLANQIEIFKNKGI